MGRAVQYRLRGLGDTPQSVIDVDPGNMWSWLSTDASYYWDLAAGNRNADGTYTAQGKQNLINQCVAGDQANIDAGTLTQAQAAANCNSVITPVLISDNADPSQNPLGTWPQWLEYAAIGLGVLLAIVVLKD